MMPPPTTTTRAFVFMQIDGYDEKAPLSGVTLKRVALRLF